MDTSHFISLFSFVRKQMVYRWHDCTDEEAITVPNGFNNNIYWNVGHLIFTTDALLLKPLGLQTFSKDGWGALFGRETSPKSWSESPVTLSELRQLAKDQGIYIQQVIGERLKQDEPLSRPLTLGSYTINTYYDVLHFILWHEGIHTSAIQSLRYATRGQNK